MTPRRLTIRQLNIMMDALASYHLEVESFDNDDLVSEVWDTIDLIGNYREYMMRQSIEDNSEVDVPYEEITKFFEVGEIGAPQSICPLDPLCPCDSRQSGLQALVDASQACIIKESKKRNQMQITNAAKQVDYFPLTSAGKGFVRRVTWHPGADSEMITFSTITKSDMVYDVNQYILNGATVTDFNLEAYQGSDYSPMAC